MGEGVRSRGKEEEKKRSREAKKGRGKERPGAGEALGGFVFGGGAGVGREEITDLRFEISKSAGSVSQAANQRSYVVRKG